MKVRRGRVVAAVAGAAVLLVAGLLAMQSREILVLYHIWRLDRAQTRTEAKPWLEALVRDSDEPGMSESIVRRLGHGHQNFTFWFFSSTGEFDFRRRVVWMNHKDSEFHLPLSIVRAACGRMETDELLLASWSHYLRWKGSGLVEQCMTEFQKPNNTVHSLVSALSLRGETAPISTRLSRNDEATFRWEFAEYLGAVWLLGMEERPSCPEFVPQPNFTITWEVPVDPLNVKLNRWIKERRGSFRFDPEKGRFVPRDALYTSSTAPSKPAEPLPGWRGPIPPPDREMIQIPKMPPGARRVIYPAGAKSQ